MYHEDLNWVQILPTVLLRLRIAIKEYISFSPTKLTYGTQLRVLGEFFVSDRKLPSDVFTFLSDLQNYMRQIQAVPDTNHHTRASYFVHPSLASCTHVFLRDDCIEKSVH